MFYDFTKKERELDERYDMTIPEGVRGFIEDIPKLRNTTYEAVVLLVDFERAIELAGISKRQKEILKKYLIQGFTQEEVAERLGISRQRVADIVMLASRRIAQIYNAWALAGEGYKTER